MPVITAGQSKVVLQRDGFLCVDGVKIGRLVRGCLELKDKDRYRSRERGSEYIYIPIEELTAALVAFCDD